MKKIALLIILLISLNACNKNHNVLQVSEQEKELVRIGDEKEHSGEVFKAVEQNNPQEFLPNEQKAELIIYNPKDFERFVPTNSRIGQVMKSSNGVTIDYFFQNNRILVEYYYDGSINKYGLNKETGILLVNLNDREYLKYYYEQIDNRVK